MKVVLAVLWKDLASEWRSRDRVVAMLVFSLLTVLVFHFAFPGSTPQENARNAPGLLWVAYIFAAVIGLNRAFAVELENDALVGLALAPGTRGFIFLGKAGATLVVVLVVHAITAVIFAMFLGLDFSGAAPRLAIVVLLGDLGICSIGTLFAAMSVRSRFRDVLLPVLLLPTLFPVLAGAVRATTAALAGEELPADAFQLLLVVDGIYLIVSFLGFDAVLDE